MKGHTKGYEEGEYAAAEGGGFSNAYQDHFSDSFHKIFSEVSSAILFLFFMFPIFMVYEIRYLHSNNVC